jgi:hypothetical protein
MEQDMASGCLTFGEVEACTQLVQQQNLELM